MYLIIFIILFINIFLIFKNKFSFLPDYIKESALGTWCMYTIFHHNKSLNINVIDIKNKKIDITDLCLDYFKNNYANGLLTTDAHNEIFPSTYVSDLLNFLSHELGLHTSKYKYIILTYSYSFKDSHFIHMNFHKI